MQHVKTLFRYFQLLALIMLTHSLRAPIGFRPLGLGPLNLSSVRCDEQYTREMEDVLRVLAFTTPKPLLQEYRTYMILVKQSIDLGFMLRPFEASIVADQRAILRTPLQNYINCRTTFSSTYSYGFSQFAPPKTLLMPCENQYAYEAQTTLNQLARTLAPNALSDYEDFLVKLKMYTDINFKIRDIEKRTATTNYDVTSQPNTTIATLRSPSRKYENCKDAIIRSQSLIH